MWFCDDHLCPSFNLRIAIHLAMKDLILFFATYLHMSLLYRSEIQSLRDRKSASKYNECKLKTSVSGLFSAFIQNEIPLLPQCQFMDLLNALKSQCKAGTIFSLAHRKDPTLLFPNFGHAVQNMLNMSMRCSFIQTQRFHAMIRMEQAQRKRPL